MLTHLRRFKTDLVKRTEAVKKATKEEECSMQEILAIMEQATYIYIYIYIQVTFAPIVRFAAAVPLFFAARAGCGWYICQVFVRCALKCVCIVKSALKLCVHCQVCSQVVCIVNVYIY